MSEAILATAPGLVVVPIADDEPLVPMDEWIRRCRQPGPPTRLSKPAWQILDEGHPAGRD